MQERDLDKNPYSDDEMRIVAFLNERGVGGGDDPIGFLLASYALVCSQRNQLQKLVQAVGTGIVDGREAPD